MNGIAPGGTKRSECLRRAAHARYAWWLGFILVANFYLLPWRAQTPRATDIAGAALAIVLLARFAQKGIRRSLLLAGLALVVSPLAWGIIGGVSGDMPTVFESVRWVLALPWAIALTFIWGSRSQRDAFLRGLFWGVALNVAVLAMQFAGFGDVARNVGLAAQDEYNNVVYYDRVRHPGMHGHPNAALPVVSLAIPAASVLTFNLRRSPMYIIGAVGMLALGAALTLTRSALLVGLLSLTLMLGLSGRVKTALPMTVLLAAFGVLLVATFGPPGGWGRWTGRVELAMNRAGRVETNLTALSIIREHPFGVGDALREELVGATHNAFLQAGVVFGAPFGLMVLGGVVGASLLALHRVFSSTGSAGAFGIHLLGLFLWEEHLKNPTFIVLAAWAFIFTVSEMPRLMRQHGRSARSTFEMEYADNLGQLTRAKRN